MQTRQLPIIVAVLTTLSAAPAMAQIIVGGPDGGDSVFVDQRVLERLGPGRSLPQLLSPPDQAPSKPDQIIKLKPPAGDRQSVKPAKTVKAAKPTKKTQPTAGKPASAAVAKSTPAQKPQPAPAQETPAEKPMAESATKAAQETAPTPIASEPAEASRVAESEPKPVAPAVPEVTKAPEAAAVRPLAPAPMDIVSSPPAPSLEPTAKVEVETHPASVALTAPTAPAPVAPPTVKAAVALPPPVPPISEPTPSVVEARGLVPPAATSPAKPAAVTSTPNKGVQERPGMITVRFPSENAELPADARGVLESLAARMEKDPQLYLQLNAYADGDDAEASKARRMSLSRALAVRSYLMNYGLRSTRIEVRALGNKAPDGPADRVDLVIEKR